MKLHNNLFAISKTIFMSIYGDFKYFQGVLKNQKLEHETITYILLPNESNICIILCKYIIISSCKY